MDYKEIRIIPEEKADFLIKSDFYKRSGKVVKVLYYNNGLVSESANNEVISRRVVTDKEKQNIILNYNRLMELRKELDEANNEMGEISKKARYIVSAQERLTH